MKTAKEIISYIESEHEKAYQQYDYWKEIDRSEAIKYRIKMNVLEDLLDDIDPMQIDKE